MLRLMGYIDWEAVFYVILLLLLWVIVRFLIEALPDLLHILYPKRDVVNVWANSVYYPVSYHSEKVSQFSVYERL